MGKAVLISIYPEHVASILGGRKIFEYRKVIPSKDVSYLVLYSTAPIMKIVAFVEVNGCIVGSPTRVWGATAFGSGITRQFFRKYFTGKRIASAFSLGRVFKLVQPMELSTLSGINSPPQSFFYLDDEDMRLILKNSSLLPTVASKMVFVGGIHGVGKSTITKNLCDLIGYKCVTASSLITEYGRKIDNNKRVGHIVENQAVLLQALDKAKLKHNSLLLDGHFTLINRRGKIVPIDIKVFRAMKPDHLILIKGELDEIVVRLQNRDGKIWTNSLLSKFQAEEEAHARYVAKDIGIPLRIISNDVRKLPINVGRRFEK
jgi:predicted transcriptional regulator/adenylate kinase